MQVLLRVLCSVCFIISSGWANDREVRASVSLGHSGTLEIISPSSRQDIANLITDSLLQAQAEMFTLLGTAIPIQTSVHLLHEETFFSVTKAPKWTNALFVNGKILIPLMKKGVDRDSITRSARHEFFHAVTHELTRGRLQGWLDEGLAQWFEGPKLSVLDVILRKWLVVEDPIPLSLLQGGFTRLETKKVAAAYAQSLYASEFLVSRFGMTALRNYLLLLGTDVSRDKAFKNSFGVTETQFELLLNNSLAEYKNRSNSIRR